jgi:hypothetical protein
VSSCCVNHIIQSTVSYQVLHSTITIVGNFKALSKNFTKDHVITVGGPGNIFERDLNYQIQDIVRNSRLLDVGLVGLLR